MERTFGVKDFVLLTVLSLLIVLVILAMVQFDRQWDEVQSVKHKLDQQAIDLQTIQRQIDHGVSVATPTIGPVQTVQMPLAEQRIAAAKTLPGYADGDWLTYGFGAHIKSLTPFIGGDAYSGEVIGDVVESLCGRDPVTLEWQGLLAESWKVEDNSKAWNSYAQTRRSVPLTEAEIKADPDFPTDIPADDQKAYVDRRLKLGRTDDDIGREKDCPPAATITFTMRDGPKFSDGTPVTAEDVEFTYRFTMNPAIDAPRERSGLSRLRDVKALDSRHVAFVFRVPYFQSMELAGSFGVMPKHFYERFKPEEYNQSTGLLMGSGPYQLDDPTSWKPGKLVELHKNPRYWGVSPAINKIVYQEFTNPIAEETSFRNGDIDQIGGAYGCVPEQYLKFTKDPDLLARTQHYDYDSPGQGYRFIAWNQMRDGKPTPFADKRVRQAMTLLIDQKRVISEVVLNLATPAIGPFTSLGKQADPELKPYPYDPDKAVRLLADAGWTDHGSGVLTNAAGQPFEFRLTYPSGRPNYEKMALLLRDFFAKAKIRLIADPQEFSVFGELLKHRNFDAVSMAWTAALEGDLYQIFHSSQMADGGDDFVSYRNPELDSTIEQARRSLDEPARMKLWHKANDLIYDDQPYTFLFYMKALQIMDKRVHNVQLLPLGLNGDSEWFIPKALQKHTAD